jgi:GT2 family glycosyltransferase
MTPSDAPAGPPGLRRLRPARGAPGTGWAPALLLAGREAEPSVLAPGDASVPPSVAQMLADPELGIGAVVPLVTSPFDRVLEAGALGTAGDLRPRGAGVRADRSSLRVRTDVDGTTFPWIAARPDVLRGVQVGVDAEPAQVARAIAERAQQLGTRVVFEPAWRVVSDQGPEPGASTPLPPEPAAGSEVLVVTGFVPSDRFRAEDQSLHNLIVDLLATADDAHVTVLAVDGYRAEPAAEALRRLGADVVSGAVDRHAWFTEHRLRFSNVIVTWSALHSDVRTLIQATQPQAIVTLYLDRLPHRDIDALSGYVPPDGLSGLELVRSALEERLLNLGPWVDTLWCEHEVDASALWSSGRFPMVSVIPGGLVGDRPPRPPSGPREGLLFLATEGHDVVEGNEEAVLTGLRDVLGPLRRRWPSLPCSVVTERPTPGLETACGDAGAELVSVARADEALAACALVVVPHVHGTGGPSTILAALAAEAPFLATGQAAAGTDLGGELQAAAVCAGVPELLLRARRLLAEPDRLRELHDAVRRRSEAARQAPVRRANLRNALAVIGLTPTETSTHPWPAEGIPDPLRRPLVLAPLRPTGWSGLPDDGAIFGEDQDARYRQWARRFGPNPVTLAALEEDLAEAIYRPLISVLVPVCNTAAWMLKEAVRSVADQIYPHWQLCIADDGSDLPETLAVLDELAADPSVRVTRLGTRSGISAATNAALATADGEYVAFLDHDDVLKPHALAQVVRWLNADPGLDLVYSDEDKLDEQGELVQPYLKPDWSPDLLRTHNYICHLTVARRSLVEKVGGLRSAFDGSQDHDLLLRLTEHTERVGHIPEPLYSWRITPGSAAAVIDAKPFAIDASRRALQEAVERRGAPARVEDLPWTGRFRTRYELLGQPKVAIIIPTKDRLDLLRRCVESVLDTSTYRNYELVLVDNQTTDGETLGYMASLPGRVIHYPRAFNYARMINLAAATVEADAFLFLNNDTAVITPDWIEALLEHAMRPEVGAVGGRLWFGPGHLQHEGIYVGIGGWASNVDHGGLHLLGDLVRNTSAVTGACTMMRPSVYWRVGGNDERLRVAYNDVDICLRIRQAGLEVVYTPHAELYHFESASRSGFEHREDGPLFGQRWEPRQRVDAYYSPVYHRDQYFRIGLGEPERTMPA